MPLFNIYPDSVTDDYYKHLINLWVHLAATIVR